MSVKTVPISVIIPCYRCGATLKRALSSVLHQTVLPREILLIDDASGDETLELLYELQTQHPDLIKVIALDTNGGPGRARNAGWDEANQPWIAFLDADDAWHPKKLEIQYKWLTDHPDVDLCGHETAYLDRETIPQLETKRIAKRLHLVSMMISNQLYTRTVMIKRELPFRFPAKKHAEDYYLWLDAIASGARAYKIEDVLAYSYRPDFSPGGLSGQLWTHEKSELQGFYQLWKNKKISLLLLLLAQKLSIIKYILRVCKVKNSLPLFNTI